MICSIPINLNAFMYPQNSLLYFLNYKYIILINLFINIMEGRKDCQKQIDIHFQLDTWSKSILYYE